ncbi:MAG: ATP-binding protein [Brumimicrobium sp.]|nr:ATP-binding protein [Brumimicrobium sp.]
MYLKKTFFNWSSGKDSALALYKMAGRGEFDLQCLLTTVTEESERVTMHGLRKELLIRQLKATEIPYRILSLPAASDHETYTRIMSKEVTTLKSEGYNYAGFGDIFLEDLRNYREKQLETVGIKGVFPLWKISTSEIIREFIGLGFKAVIICVDGQKLDPSFLGREINESLINDLPKDVDVCGENGEFHTFCYDGPVFNERVDFVPGEIVTRSYEVQGGSHAFHFLDLK